MQYEPRPAIYMEKHLVWAYKLDGAESLRISKVGHTVLARLMESQIRHQLAGSVWAGFRKGTMASAHPDARHFRFSMCTTGAFQSAISELELRRSRSE